MKHLLRNFIVPMSAMALVAMNFPAPIFGQTTLAIRGGMSRATFSGSDDDISGSDDELKERARTGLTLGASATIPMQEKLSLRLDGSYVQKGDSAKGGGVEANIHLDYIEFSGLGVVNLTPPGSPASVYALAGPSLAFNTGCSVSASMEGNTTSVSCDEADAEVRAIDFGITGGVGAAMAASEQVTFSVELHYTLGLLSVTGEGDGKNRNLILRAGVGFPIGQ